MTFRSLALVLLLTGLSGCAALTSVNDASVELDAYTLAPLAVVETPARSVHLVVQLPTSAGALATDRILIKPSALQAQYLPDGRWTDPAPVLVQTLLLASLQNAGGFQLVDRDGGGLMPDYTLMTELQDFQAEPGGSDGPVPDGPVTVRMRVAMTLIRESDLSIAASRQFSATAIAASDSTPALIMAFDKALREVLNDVVNWTREQT